MRIICVVENLEENKIVNFIHKMFFDYIIKDITIRNQRIVLKIGSEEITVYFVSKYQSQQATAGLPADLRILEI